MTPARTEPLYEPDPPSKITWRYLCACGARYETFFRADTLYTCRERGCHSAPKRVSKW